MASLSKEQNGERQYPSLIVTVVAALVAQNRELSSQNQDLSSQIAFLSTGKARIQSAMSEQAGRIVELEHLLSDERRESANLIKDAADLLVRAIVAEKALQAKQNLHKITMTALDQKIEGNMTKNADGNVQPSLHKRKQESSDHPHRPTKKVKKATIVCIECYKNKVGRRCDGESPCWPCKCLGKECKRMRCKYFDVLAEHCQVSNCTLAHINSGFPEELLENNHHVAQSNKAAPIVPAKPRSV